MSDPRLPGGLACDEVRDLAAAFVLDALPDDEMAAVREHLATCAEPHPEIAELGGVLPVIHASLRPLDPPAALKDRIMAAAAADLEARRAPATEDASAVVPPDRVAAPEPVSITRSARLRTSWVLGLAAAVAIVLLGGWNLSLQARLDDALVYQSRVAAVLDAAAAPGALTAVMTSPTGDGPKGLAAVTPDGEMRIAMRDLAPTAGDEVYEAWVIEPESAPVALGGFRVGADGVGYLEATGLPADPGIVLALTREPRPGMTAPSSDPVSVGTAAASATT